MITEKKGIVIFSIIKAIITTAILGFAINGVNTIIGITDPLIQKIAFVVVGGICILGTIIYVRGLQKDGFLKSINNLIYFYGLDWKDNAERLTKSWAYSIPPLLVVLGLWVALFCFGTFGLFSLCFSTISGLLFVYISRNECKSLRDRIKYFLYGYVFGIGMIITGLLISFLISRFGIFWIGGLLLIDAGFTGFYTYLDLLDWEQENKVMEERRTARMGTNDKVSP